MQNLTSIIASPKRQNTKIPEEDPIVENEGNTYANAPSTLEKVEASEWRETALTLTLADACNRHITSGGLNTHGQTHSFLPVTLVGHPAW